MELVRDPAHYARSRPVIDCAQCGERLYVPEWTEYRDGGRVLHLWRCEACGCSFETAVRFFAAKKQAVRSAGSNAEAWGEPASATARRSKEPA
jgi:hypothetical protein